MAVRVQVPSARAGSHRRNLVSPYQSRRRHYLSFFLGRACNPRRPIASQPDHPLSEIFLERLSTIRRRHRASLRLQLVWAPLSGDDHRCVSLGRSEAKLAAERPESEDSELRIPQDVADALRGLRTERAVLQKQHEALLLSQWKALWLESPQGARCAHAVDDTPPSLKAHPIYRGLSRAQCSILTQLRCGHVGLNAYLARIGAVDSPLCPRCLIPETPAHYLFTCRRYTEERDALRRAVKGPLSLKSTVGNVKARAAVLEFVQATGRFEAYRLGNATG